MKFSEVEVSQAFGAFLVGLIVGAPTGAFVAVALLYLDVVRLY